MAHPIHAFSAEFDEYEPGALSWGNVKATLGMITGAGVLVAVVFAFAEVLRMMNF